jgi:hypothetical protein
LTTLHDQLSQEAAGDIFMALQLALESEYGLNDGAIDRRLAAQALGETPASAQ